MKCFKYIVLLYIASSQLAYSQSQEGNVNNLPVKEYTITLRQAMVNKAGKEVMGMTVNGSIPGPTLEFTEGEYAIIHVKNEMSVETSVHWHGILLPNFYDGVEEVSSKIKSQWEELNLDVKSFLGQVGLSQLAGEHGRTALEMIWARPTCEINGI